MSVRNASWLFATAMSAVIAGPAFAQDILSFESADGTVSLLQDGNVAYEENTNPDADPNSVSMELEDVPKQAVNDPNPDTGNNLTIIGVNGAAANNTDSIGLDGGLMMDDGLLSMTGPGAIASSYNVDVAKTITGGPDGNDGAPSQTAEYSAFVGEVSSSISTGDFGALSGAGGGAGGAGQTQMPTVGTVMDAFNQP